MVIVIKTLETPKNIKAKGSSSDYIKSRVINGDNKNELRRLFTPRDTLQTIDMIGCIVTGFMRKMRYNAFQRKILNQSQNKFGFTFFAELRGRDTR